MGDAATAAYVCPHHPEVTATEPGERCPKCDMKLVPNKKDPAAASDASISFDPVAHTVPGLEVYDWVRRIREPAYAAARRSRGLPA